MKPRVQDFYHVFYKFCNVSHIRLSSDDLNQEDKEEDPEAVIAAKEAQINNSRSPSQQKISR